MPKEFMDSKVLMKNLFMTGFFFIGMHHYIRAPPRDLYFSKKEMEVIFYEKRYDKIR